MSLFILDIGIGNNSDKYPDHQHLASLEAWGFIQVD